MAASKAMAVREPDRLEELATTANLQYSLAGQAGSAMLEHAILCGEALLEAKELVPWGEWSSWLEEKFAVGAAAQAYRFMRLARYKDVIGSQKDIKTAIAFLRGAPRLNLGDSGKWAEQEDAKKLRAAGMTYSAIGEQLGVSAHTAWSWCNPKKFQALKASQLKKRKAEQEALRRASREAQVKRVGGSLWTAWKQVVSTQGKLDSARTDKNHEPEVRRAIESAMQSLYNAEDKLALAAKLQDTKKPRPW